MAGRILSPCNVARGSGILHWIRQVEAPCNMTRRSGIMTLNSPGGRTLQCGMWLWDHDIYFTRWQHPAMWHVVLESWHWIRQVGASCNMARGSGIMPLHSLGGSTLQCGTWLWYDMTLNSPKRPPYWNSTSGFDFDYTTTVDMASCTSLRNFIQIGPPKAAKKWRHVYFQDGGSPPSWILGVQWWILWKAYVRLPIGRQ